jgi:AraC-like DNA-binding protein
VTLLAGHDDLEEVGLARSVVHPWVWRESLLVSDGTEADRHAALALLRRMDVWRGTGDTEVPAREADALRAQWLSLAARVVAGARPWPRPRPHDWRAALDVRAVERHVRARLAEPIYLRDLRDATGIPERTMQDAFRTVLGMRPMAYIETLRLHALHADLLESGPRAPRTVSEAARRNGIAHLSRLAGRYRAIFGENPRETIARARERTDARPADPSAR